MNGRDACTPDELAGALTDARARTLGLVEDLSDEEMIGPRLAVVNPFLWEIGHVAWFQERWCQRAGGGPSIHPRADGLWDSISIEHDVRWDLLLPSRPETLRYLADVLDLVLEALPRRSPEELALHRLALDHEDMHGEAFVMMRHVLGFPPPACAAEEPPSGAPLAGDAEIEGGPFRLGAEADAPHVLDNEREAHVVELAPFRIARSPVTEGELAAFAEDGGYARRELWSAEGWRWRERAGAEAPADWRREEGAWSVRCFDQWRPLAPERIACRLSFWEAEAYCSWAGRRLPTEAEWERAARGDVLGGAGRSFPWGEEPPSPERAQLDLSCAEPAGAGALPLGATPEGARGLLGGVWEWTASVFGPYPGFAPGPYREYSAPWFGTRRVLRGGSFATRARLLRSTWRNFYEPDRRDALAGFRTAEGA